MNDLNCDLCIEKFKEKYNYEFLRKLVCGHNFCPACLCKLLSDGCKKCPTCHGRFASTKAETLRFQNLTRSRARKNIVDNIKLKSVYAVKDDCDGSKRYGKLTWKDERIWINSFQLENPGPVSYYDFFELLTRFRDSKELPKTAFLQITSNDEKDFEFPGRDLEMVEIVIEANNSPRAKNFIHLCSGLKGHSFKGENMVLEGESPPLYYEIAPGPPQVVAGISQADLRTQQKRGGVYGSPNCNSSLRILLGDADPENPAHQIGEVVEGLHYLGNIKEEFTIEECGLIFRT